MAKYHVIGSGTLRHDGKTYQPGDVVELTAEQAEKMPWAVELVKPKEAKETKEAEAPVLSPDAIETKELPPKRTKH